MNERHVENWGNSMDVVHKLINWGNSMQLEVDTTYS